MEPVACPPIKRRTLAIFLERLEVPPRPKAELEQYPTPAEIAANLLFKAYGRRDIYQRSVADLGCGNGILAIGASWIGAQRTVAVDVDPGMVEVARRNAESVGVSVDFRIQRVKDFREPVDTVVMNPPFGGQRKHADIPFIEAALRCAPVAYSFHNAETRDFIEVEVGELGGDSELLATYKFPLRHSQPFHTRGIKEVDVDLFRFEGEFHEG